MTDQVALKLSDQEWRLKCEELAKSELDLRKQEAELAEEAEEWKDRKSDLLKAIDAKRAIIAQLAREVDTRQTMVDAQQELEMGGDAAKEQPAEEDPAKGKTGDDPPAEREPGEEG